jgi:uncharacterized protein involved in exopolysaccharide biosynthesis
MRESQTPPLNAFYEKIIQEALSAFWQRRLFVAGTVVLTLALGALTVFLMKKQYTATAVVHAGYTDPEASSVNKGPPPINLDATLLVETRSRLFSSQQTARRVVESLGLERLRGELGSGPNIFQRLFDGDNALTLAYQQDRAATKLLNRLSVKTEPRVYLIKVSYTASDPELAALITNAFVAEFVQATTLQMLGDDRSAMDAEVMKLTASYGEKHPAVVAARAKRASADAYIKEQSQKTPLQLLARMGASVTPAEAVSVPSSPDPILILAMSGLLGLLTGVVVAVWLGRRQLDAEKAVGSLA